MRYLLLIITLATMASCMKSKENYREAISDIQRQEEVEREEAPRNNQRSRGSNDAEGMGMDE